MSKEREEARARAVEVLGGRDESPSVDWIMRRLEAAGLVILDAREVARLDAAEAYAEAKRAGQAGKRARDTYAAWLRLRLGDGK